jgi:hypothetical protein
MCFTAFPALKTVVSGTFRFRIFSGVSAVTVRGKEAGFMTTVFFVVDTFMMSL